MQHRRVYIDDWCLMEKICLVSGVLRFGENSWPSICDLIKPKLQENRPWDWFTPDTCEAQYKILLNEYVKAQANVENPALQIIQQLRTRCKIESQRKDEQRSKYMSLKKKLESLLKNEIEVELIEKYYGEIQRKKNENEERLRKHQEFLKERETKKSEFEKANAPKTPQKQETKTDGGSSPLVTSPLLSSLLNNPPAVQYRPTLSTTSFVPTKSTQSTSRSSSFEKSQSFIDSTFKDSFSQELSDHLRTPERQSTPGISSQSVVKKLDFQDNGTSSTASSIHNPVSESNIKVHTLSTETPKLDHQNLDNLALISPSEEVYLSEVDIPSEALLEVIDDLKVGTLSLDKLIRDLEATEESIIISKEDLHTVTDPMDDSFTEKIESQSPIPEIKTDVVDGRDAKIAEEKVEIPTNHIEEQVVVIENSDKEESDERVETEDIVNIEISSENNSEQSKKEDSSVSSTSYSTAVNVELEQSLSEQKAENEVTDDDKLPSVKEEIDEDEAKNKSNKSVVVIKRIEDSSSLANKNRRSRKIIAEENVEEEFENVSVVDNITINEDEKPESKILEVENDQDNDKAENLMETVEITSENDAEEKPHDEMDEQKNPDSEDSDSEKFEDALQTHVEEVSEQHNEIAEVADKLESVSNIDESFVLEVDDKSDIQENSIEKMPDKELEQPVEHPVLDETKLPEKPESTDNETPNVIENTERVEEQENLLLDKELVDEKNSEEIMLGPTKIIKKYGRKRKSISESNEDISEISIRIPPVVLQEIETADSDIEQAFTEKNVKIEPSDTKPEDQINQQKDEATQEKSGIKENTPAKVKQERRDTKTPEKNVIKVLRRSSGKSQNSLRRNEESKTKGMDNMELIKTRKKSIMLAYSRLTTHKYSNAFQKPITNKQVPGYENIIYKPMDLYTIKKKIENRQISSVAEFQRDVLLMLNNAKMFNRINSQVYNMAVEVEDDALPHIQLTVQTLGEGILRREEENNEKNRKRLSLDNAKKDSKSIKRIKCSTKDDSFSGIPLKKPKLEENDDDRGQTN